MGHHTGMDQSLVRSWEGHVIVCGLQGVGLRMVEQLHQAEVQVVVVEHTLQLVGQAAQTDPAVTARVPVGQVVPHVDAER